MQGKQSIAVMVALLLHATAAGAQVTETPNLLFNGFGTVGVIHSDEDQADFVSSTLAPDGAGHTRNWSFEVDSRLGLQLTANLTPRLSGVMQVVAEQRHDDSYSPLVEWANFKFDITPDWSVRAGRIVLPVFMASEYRKVGYAIPWVRPPAEVYRLVPVGSNDGIDVSYRTHFGEVTNTLRGNYGRKDVTTASGGKVRAREGVTVTDTLERGPLTLFAGYTRARVTVEEVQPLFDAIAQFGPQGAALAERYDADDKRVEILSIGARHDPGDWFVMGEWARSSSRSFLGDKRGWYLTGGYRFGPVTPYITLARARVESVTSDPGLAVAGLPPALAAQAAALNATLNTLLARAPEQQSLSLGVRWDFARNVALKLQFDHLDLDAGSAGILVNEQPGFRRGGAVSLFSATLDFVF
jgi:hypothetical protein